MKADGETQIPPNCTRQMIGVFAGQLVLVAALCAFSDSFSAWLNWLVAITVIALPPLAYLKVLASPSMRREWRELLADSWKFFFSVSVAFARLFRPATFAKLARIVVSLKPAPNTVDEWITCCVLPFKAWVVLTFPTIWLVEKIVTWIQPHHGGSRPSFDVVIQWYLISLLGLLFGALLQALFCRPGRAFTTLRFFLWGIASLLILALVPRLI
ncbi:MAG TPA: hypothetical protein VFY06_05085 [Verrucomicrobiae bacterium]|nr:hypothetical protein [Verrucomicrobiae bacterium]